MDNPVLKQLDEMDSQRESAFAALNGLTGAQIWQKPAPKEWSISEILDHNMRLYDTLSTGDRDMEMVPLVRRAESDAFIFSRG